MFLSEVLKNKKFVTQVSFHHDTNYFILNQYKWALKEGNILSPYSESVQVGGQIGIIVENKATRMNRHS